LLKHFLSNTRELHITQVTEGSTIFTFPEPLKKIRFISVGPNKGTLTVLFSHLCNVQNLGLHSTYI
jgi:hypothetical protein